MKRKLPLLDKRYKKHRPLSEEEAIVWQEEMEGKKKPVPLPIATAEAKPVLKPARKEKIKTPALSVLDKVMHTKIRRGHMEIEATLDLHGHTQATAYGALLHFITHARENGTRLVLVITGKGKAGGGVLRELFPLWLEESPFRTHIIAYDTASPRHGGQGAWVVRLRKKQV